MCTTTAEEIHSFEQANDFQDMLEKTDMEKEFQAFFEERIGFYQGKIDSKYIVLLTTFKKWGSIEIIDQMIVAVQQMTPNIIRTQTDATLDYIRYRADLKPFYSNASVVKGLMITACTGCLDFVEAMFDEFVENMKAYAEGTTVNHRQAFRLTDSS